MSARPSPRTYTYRPVDAARKGFRLAILEPSPEFEAPIRCSLNEVSAAEHPEYEAISYVWGDPSNRACLEIEGDTLMVTANLVLALRYIRHKADARCIWADAICIDQANLEERAQQVQLMKNIYTLCTRDLLWVGEQDEFAENAIEVLRRMGELGLRRRRDKISFGQDGSLKDSGIGWDERVSLYSIFTEPKIWERVWVMQEICCCPNVMILIGNHSIPWSMLSNILDHSGIPDRFHGPFSHASPDTDFWSRFAGVQVIEHQRDSVQEHHVINSTLLDVLSRFREKHSTDPRDKIYGLLGLVSDDHGIVPNYHKSVKELYIQIVKAQIREEHNLDMITQSLWPLGGDAAESKDIIHSTMDLPSWLPNFSSTATKKLLFAQREIFASGPATFTKPTTFTATGKLQVYGALIGKIKTIKQPDHTQLGLGVILGGIAPRIAQHNMPDALMTPASREVKYPTGGDAFEAYWRTLLADCDVYPTRRLSGKDIKKYGEIFTRWRRTLPDSLELPNYVKDEEKLANQQLREAFRSRTELQRMRSLADKIYEWRFAELANGLYSLVPLDGSSRTAGGAAKEGDSVFLVDGGKVPLALRSVSKSKSGEEGGEWEVLGTAYVHGYMDDAWKMADRGLLQWVQISLI
jgi:hypothetical protein